MIKGFKQFLGVLLICILSVIHAQQFLFGAPKDSARCLVAKGKVTGKVYFVNSLIGVFKNVSIFLLTLFHCFSCPFLLGDIPRSLPKPNGVAFCIPNERYRKFVSRRRSVFSDKFMLRDLYWFPCFVGFCEELLDFFSTLFTCIPVVVHPDQFFFGISEMSASHIIDEGKITTKINLRIAVLNAVKNVSISLLTLSQRLFYLLSIRDVLIGHQVTFVGQSNAFEEN